MVLKWLFRALRWLHLVDPVHLGSVIHFLSIRDGRTVFALFTFLVTHNVHTESWKNRRHRYWTGVDVCIHFGGREMASWNTPGGCFSLGVVWEPPYKFLVLGIACEAQLGCFVGRLFHKTPPKVFHLGVVHERPLECFIDEGFTKHPQEVFHFGSSDYMKYPQGCFIFGWFNRTLPETSFILGKVLWKTPRGLSYWRSNISQINPWVTVLFWEVVFKHTLSGSVSGYTQYCCPILSPHPSLTASRNTLMQQSSQSWKEGNDFWGQSIVQCRLP